MTIAAIHRLGAVELAQKIRARELSSREVVEAHIARIEAVNHRLNAVVARRYEDARREADQADARVARGDADLPPFHGVPCTIKEAFALTGMPNSSGLVARRHVRATSDATAVARLRSSGAIPLGVTNVSELCMWMESNNRVYGRSNNPYDHERTVGGSSGGEGAVVGAGGSPFGLGSDVGGSIRMPAFFNGVFGHKPTGGLVPGTGQYPMASGPVLRYLTTGPITRKATDLMPLLRVLAGPDGLDAGCEARALGEPDVGLIKGMVVLDVPDSGIPKVETSLLDAQARAVDALARRGAKVKRARFDELKRSIELWSAMMGEGNDVPFAVLLGDGQAVRPVRELARVALGMSPHTLPAVGLALLEKVTHLSPKMTREMCERGKALRQQVAQAIGPNGVLLYPSHTRPAPRHHVPLLPPVQWGYTAIWNVLENPVTQVPLGLDAKGLPLGVQVVAQHGNDHLGVAVALALEEDLGGWVPPPR